ncbi:MAG: hypothetical protein HY922_14180, partial [Elusimicrobia bacterium]|nr:hypothetical protein [Elusimicrobiota bacterium]
TRYANLNARIAKNNAEAEVIDEEKKRLEEILPELIAGQKVLKATKCSAKKKEICPKTSETLTVSGTGGKARFRKTCIYTCPSGKVRTVVVTSLGSLPECPKSVSN